MGKKLTKEEKYKMKLLKAYNGVKEFYELSGSPKEQIHQLVQYACELQKEMNDLTDTINVDGFDKATEFVGIDKPTWNEFIMMTAKKRLGKLKDKALDKFEENCQRRRYISNLRQSFYDTYLSGDALKIVDDSSLQSYHFDNVEDDEFAELLEEYAHVKDDMNVIRKKLSDMALAAEYITDQQMKKDEFKDLVQWEFYKDSEDPAHPSKSWQLFDKFNKMVRIMDKYEFDQLGELENEFGLKHTFGIAHPKVHGWQNISELD